MGCNMIKENIIDVEKQIEDACLRSGRQKEWRQEGDSYNMSKILKGKKGIKTLNQESCIQ